MTADEIANKILDKCDTSRLYVDDFWYLRDTISENIEQLQGEITQLQAHVAELEDAALIRMQTGNNTIEEMNRQLDKAEQENARLRKMVTADAWLKLTAAKFNSDGNDFWELTDITAVEEQRDSLLREYDAFGIDLRGLRPYQLLQDYINRRKMEGD